MQFALRCCWTIGGYRWVFFGRHCSWFESYTIKQPATPTSIKQFKFKCCNHRSSLVSQHQLELIEQFNLHDALVLCSASVLHHPSLPSPSFCHVMPSIFLVFRLSDSFIGGLNTMLRIAFCERSREWNETGKSKQFSICAIVVHLWMCANTWESLNVFK